MRTRFVERDTSADNGDTGSRHFLVQIASGPDPRDLPANHGRGAHEAAGNPHSRIRNAFDNRFRDVDGELGTRTATERNEPAGLPSNHQSNSAGVRPRVPQASPSRRR